MIIFRMTCDNGCLYGMSEYPTTTGLPVNMYMGYSSQYIDRAMPRYSYSRGSLFYMYRPDLVILAQIFDIVVYNLRYSLLISTYMCPFI